MTRFPLLKGLRTMVGAVLVAISVGGLTTYFVQVGFRLDDTLGWIGVVVGLTGLTLALTGRSGDGIGAGPRPGDGDGHGGPVPCEHVVRFGHGAQSLQGSAVNGPVTQIHNWPDRPAGRSARTVFAVSAALAVPAVTVAAGLLGPLGLPRSPVPAASVPPRLSKSPGPSTAPARGPSNGRIRGVVAAEGHGRDAGDRPADRPSTDRPGRKDGRRVGAGPARPAAPAGEPRARSASEGTVGTGGAPLGAWQGLLPFPPVRPLTGRHGPLTGRHGPEHPSGSLDLTGPVMSGARLLRPGTDGPTSASRP